MTFIALATSDEADSPTQDWLVEQLNNTTPANLYEAFRATLGTRRGQRVFPGSKFYGSGGYGGYRGRYGSGSVGGYGAAVGMQQA